MDTAKSVRAIRDKKAQGAATGADVGGLKEAGEGQSAGGAAKCGGHYAYFKEGMLVSQSVALIDVALADFSILASSQAFRWPYTHTHTHVHTYAHTCKERERDHVSQSGCTCMYIYIPRCRP